MRTFSSLDGSYRRQIGLSKDAFNSHIFGGHRSIDGQFYMFVVYHSNTVSPIFPGGYVKNDEAHLFLPRYLITYCRKFELA